MRKDINRKEHKKKRHNPIWHQNKIAHTLQSKKINTKKILKI